MYIIQSAQRPEFSFSSGNESRTRKLRLHYGKFVQENINMADLTAALFESTLCISEACAKALVPRTS